jgi:hypothetical protein
MDWSRRFRGSRFLLSFAGVSLAASLTMIAQAGPAAASQGQPAAAAVASKVTPAIINQLCTSGTSNWVHVYSQDVGVFCLGFQGTWVFNNGHGRWANKVTFGNNYGYLYYATRDSTGGLIQWYENFDGGNPYANELDCSFIGGCLLQTLHIQGWH